MTETKGLAEKVDIYLQQKNWQEIYDLALQKEIYDAAVTANYDEKSQFFYSIQLLSALLLNQTINARFLWRRLPAKVKKASPELGAIWRIGKALWVKNLRDFYRALDDYRWSDSVKPYIVALRDQKREQAKDLIARAYNSVALTVCQEMLNLPEQQTIASLQDAGWRVDVQKGMVFPAAKTVSASKKDQQHTTTTQLSQLTNYISYLELS